MRKINKSCDLSTVYKTWEEALEASNQPHPKYNSSKGEYYWDIVMQLHRCQGGLCAYTEQELCDEPLFVTENWSDGRYSNPPQREGRFGQLEHFDESLKSKKDDIVGKKDWLWDNFFMVHSDINQRKGIKPVDNILKPDLEDYDPFEKLDYDFDLHVFIPNSNLSEADFERVKNMIEVLGINHVYSIRGKFLGNRLRLKYLNNSDIIEAQVQFPTSFEMIERKLNLGEITLDEIVL